MHNSNILNDENKVSIFVGSILCSGLPASNDICIVNFRQMIQIITVYASQRVSVFGVARDSYII